MIVIIAVFVGVMWALIYVPTYLRNLSAPATNCWDIKEVRGEAIKLNKCTGEVQPLDMPKAASAVK
jgi:hypothetical protein